MKIMILGYARHGKDTVSEYLRDRYGFTFTSSSVFLAERLIFPALKDKYGYKTIQECFEDRNAHRAEWYDLIMAYNYPDRAKLVRDIYEVYDIYCGLRSIEEFQAAKDTKLFDVCFWVDASGRVPPEDQSSCTVTPDLADYVLDNNHSLQQLYANIDNIMETLNDSRYR